MSVSRPSSKTRKKVMREGRTQEVGEEEQDEGDEDDGEEGEDEDDERG